MAKKRDITGQRFGMLTALQPTDQRYIDKSVIWECQCDCGKVILQSISYLLSGRIKSCGCNRIINLAGKRFGRLTVLRRTDEKRDRDYLWECLCDCGNIVNVRGNCLRTGGTQSCGCLGKEIQKAALGKFREKSNIEGTSILCLCQKPRATNTSGVVGVFFHTKTKKWRTNIGFKGKVYYLGAYNDKNDAIAARKKAEEELHVRFLKEHHEREHRPSSDNLINDVVEQKLEERIKRLLSQRSESQATS